MTNQLLVCLSRKVWRELAVVGKDIRAARAWHLNRMQLEQDAEANALRARGIRCSCIGWFVVHVP